MLTAEEKNKMLHEFLAKNSNRLATDKFNYIKFNDITNIEDVAITFLSEYNLPHIIGAVLTLNNMSFQMKYPEHSHLLRPVEDDVKKYMEEIMQRWQNKTPEQCIAIVLFPNILIPAGWDISIIDYKN